MISPKLVADIKNAEGCNLASYLDSLGKWTIGYGHLMDQSKPCAGVTITADQATSLLEQDILVAMHDAYYLKEWKFLDTECRQNAVIEMVFNIGSAKWQLFKRTRDAIQIHDWQTAHDQLLTSLWAKQVGPTRSNRIANQLLTGSY